MLFFKTGFKSGIGLSIGEKSVCKWSDFIFFQYIITFWCMDTYIYPLYVFKMLLIFMFKIPFIQKNPWNHL